MRAILLRALLVSLGSTGVATAQTDSSAYVSAVVGASARAGDRPASFALTAKLALLRITYPGLTVPAQDSFHIGPRSIPAGTSVPASIGVASGDLDVSGMLIGNAIVVDGDIRVHPGGSITGEAVAVGGQVRQLGGTIGGATRSLRGRSWGGTQAAEPQAPRSTWGLIRVTLACFAILFLIGLGVMVFAESNLDAVVGTLETSVTRAFWIGLLGEFLALPALLLLCLGLAITVVGILLVPFAIVAFIVAGAGLLTLGLLAVARLLGSSMVGEVPSLAPRGAHLRALLIGVTVFAVLWVAAMGLTALPVVGTVVRGVALAVTWVAITTGLGATLISRAGSGRIRASRDTAKAELSWQTPTPIAGVAAARAATPSLRR